MRSTFHGLEVSKRALFVQQDALNTAGHNIANASTEGYSRQRVNMVAANPIEAPAWSRSTAPGQLGTGVVGEDIERVRVQFLDNQFRGENKTLGEWTVKEDTLEKLEGIINEPSETGIRQVVEEFWNAWSELSKDPDNPTTRGVLKERSLALVDTFNYTSQKLNELQDDLTNSISIKVDEVNSTTKQIADLNEQIYKIEALGQNANDLRDRRDLLTDQLSKIINIDVSESANGYTISMGSVEIVNGRSVSTYLDEGDITGYVSSGDLSSGEIYGMAVSRDGYVEQYKKQMDTLIQTIATGEMKVTLPAGTLLPIGSVVNGVTIDATNQLLITDTEVTVQGINGLHKLGYTMESPLTTGEDFFTIRPGYGSLTAESIQLNPNISDNLNKIAASTRFYTDGSGTQYVVKGNWDLSLAISEARNLKFDFDPSVSGGLSNGTIDEFFQSVVGQLGVQTQEAIRQVDNQEILVSQVDQRRQSVSGVSIDEEMANLVKFQHAYNASARMITTIDEMLDKVINGMGIVGR